MANCRSIEILDYIAHKFKLNSENKGYNLLYTKIKKAVEKDKKANFVKAFKEYESPVAIVSDDFHGRSDESVPEEEHNITVEQQSGEVGAPEAVRIGSMGGMLANKTT
ncbi:hypothetical protein QYM36_002778 [Artemia franciscana]|uniref:Uncharacterized protein n=1 Tax=Artemia franciscana TaxID=6661 RepID=A0AA88L8G1_ARTSF|nr:hypothetical protein QYM36_002778 [Artemia franciscana]